MKRKIYVVGGSYGYANWMEGELVLNLKDADLVVFTGGEDINPDLYAKRSHPETRFNDRRDRYEVVKFQEARKYDKKLIGICRGSQLLCALAGGSVVQHQYHPSVHDMETVTGTIRVTSSHHQRQYPYNSKHVNFELIGWCNNLAPYSEGEGHYDNLNGKPEVEIAVYPDINALAIQSHPEWAYPTEWLWEEKYIKFCREILDAYMVVKTKVLI